MINCKTDCQFGIKDRGGPDIRRECVLCLIEQVFDIEIQRAATVENLESAEFCLTAVRTWLRADDKLRAQNVVEAYAHRWWSGEDEEDDDDKTN